MSNDIHQILAESDRTKYATYAHAAGACCYK